MNFRRLSNGGHGAVAAVVMLVSTSSDMAAQEKRWKVEMMRDIRPGAASSSPGNFFAVGPTVFFTADNGVHGRELWRTNGTANGTVMVRDINPGAADGIFVSSFSSLDSVIIFRANDGLLGPEVWRSDGTAAGTFVVADINAGPPGSDPFGFTEADGSLLFNASEPAGGAELYRTDGTPLGTELVMDISPGAADSAPNRFTSTGSAILFTANRPAEGRELWRTLGTFLTTTLVRDINPGAGISGIPISSPLVRVGDRVFFMADDGVSGNELWSSNGTFAGTALVRDINPGAGNSSPGQFAAVGSLLFFSASAPGTGFEIWRSNGTLAGTFLLRDIDPGAAGSSPASITNLNGTAMFRASDPAMGEELWRSDGTTADTLLVKDIRPGATGSGPDPLGVAGGELLFAADDGTHGMEVWASDGTTKGTRMVADLNPGAAASITSAVGFAAPDGSLYFQAMAAGLGEELFRAVLDRDGPRVLGVKKRRTTKNHRLRLKGRLQDDLFAERTEYRVKRPGKKFGKWRKTKLLGKSPDRKRWVVRLKLPEAGRYVVRFRGIDGAGNKGGRKKARIIRL